MAYESKRWWDDVGGEVIMCSYCKYLYQNVEGVKCKAFPNGIPKDLMLRGEHNSSYPGDNGIRFEPKEE